MSAARYPVPSDQDCATILDFLEGRLDGEARDRFVARLSAEPRLLESVEDFAVMDRLQRRAMARSAGTGRGELAVPLPRRVVPIWALRAAAAVLLLTLGFLVWRNWSTEETREATVAWGASRDVFSPVRSGENGPNVYVGVRVSSPASVRLFSLDDRGVASALDLDPTGGRSSRVSTELTFGPYLRTWGGPDAPRALVAVVVLVTTDELADAKVEEVLSQLSRPSTPEILAELLKSRLSRHAVAIVVNL